MSAVKQLIVLGSQELESGTSSSSDSQSHSSVEGTTAFSTPEEETPSAEQLVSTPSDEESLPTTPEPDETPKQLDVLQLGLEVTIPALDELLPPGLIGELEEIGKTELTYVTSPRKNEGALRILIIEVGIQSAFRSRLD